MSKETYRKRIIVRITEQQLRMVIQETINEQTSKSSFVRTAITEKLNSKKK